MKIAVCPGSFDPITIGHLDIIKKAAKEYDLVYVLLAINPDKSYLFALEQRINMAIDACAKIDNVKVCYTDSLTVDFCAKVNANTIVKGYRNDIDLQYEQEMAKINKSLNSNIETILIKANEKYQNISSTLVKHYLSEGKDVSRLVPSEIIKYIKK